MSFQSHRVILVHDTLTKELTLCTRCRSRRGNFLTSNKIVRTESAETLALLVKQNPTWESLYRPDPPFEFATEEPIQILPDAKVPALSGLISRGDQHTNHHFSLDIESALMKASRSSGLIGASSWGLDVGSDDPIRPRTGKLHLGGYDKERFLGQTYNFPINRSHPYVQGRRCPLQLTVESLSMRITFPDGKFEEDTNIISPDAAVLSCLEPYDDLFRLSNSSLTRVVKWITETTGWKQEKNAKHEYGGLLNLEPGLIYSFPPNQTLPTLSMELSIKDGPKVVFDSDTIFRRMKGLDIEGVPQYSTRFREVQFYHESGVEKAPVLGRVFLSMVRFIDFLGFRIKQSANQLPRGFIVLHRCRS
jgi:hypothetical protein